MKYFRFVLSVLLMSLSTMAFAQSDMHKSDVQKSAVQKSFEKLKTLDGSWEGHISVPGHPEMDNKSGQVTFRVTSRGNALVHEMKESGTPNDPTRYDHPVTMFYLDGDRLLLTHYCDAGNRPRMTGKMSPDGKTVEFEFLDVAGSTEYGHMHHAVFTFIDSNHHTEDWTYIEPGDKPVHAHFELQRTK